ncbi:MAG: hypothetical protein AVDCRST_MAG40-1362, partial [uncultured Gemmatimonadaceae bacterium]
AHTSPWGPPVRARRPRRGLPGPPPGPHGGRADAGAERRR